MASVILRGHAMTVQVELITEECPTCGILFAWPKDFHRNVRQAGNRGRGYCPSGHLIQWATSEADAARKELNTERLARQRAEQSAAMWKDDADAARERAERERRRANGYKGHASKMTKRVKAGVCPCCNRTFKQLAAHMASQHPTFTPIEIDEGAPA